MAFNGPLNSKRLDGVDGRAYFSIKGDFANATVATYPGLPAAREVVGRYEWEKNQMQITVARAKIGQQVATDVGVNITKIFDPEPTEIAFLGTATGPTQEALDMAAAVLDQPIPLLVKGEHITALRLAFPLKTNLTLAETSFKSSTDLVNLRLQVPRLKVPYESTANSYFEVTENQLEFNGTGLLDEQPVTLHWLEDLRQPLTRSQIEFAGQLDAQLLNPYLSGVTLGGSVAGQLAIKQQGTDRYDFDLQADLADTSVQAPAIAWQKNAGPALKLTANGQLQPQAQVLTLPRLVLTGVGTQVQGQARIPFKKIAQAQLDLPVVRLGRQDFSLAYGPGQLRLSGKRLELPSLKPQPADKTKQQNDLLFADGEVTVNLAQLGLRQNTLSQVKGNFTRRQGWWHAGQLTAQLPEAKTLSLRLQPREGGKVEAQLESNDAGGVLRALQVHQHFRGGALKGQLTFAPDAQGQVTGRGHVHITDTRVDDAPILLRLLQLLSLETLTDPGSGVLFKSIQAPLVFAPPLLRLEKLVAKGPTLGVQLTGDINLAEERLQLKGLAIPVRGINQAVAKIPLLGPLLTGSQEALVAANFSVKGPFSKPEIFLNPLSLVTPGLIKDFFGAIFSGGSDATAPADSAPPAVKKDSSRVWAD